jgi:hypothetical protein
VSPKKQDFTARCFAALHVEGESIDVDAIERALSITATRVTRSGDHILRTRTAKKDVWTYQPSKPARKPLSSQIEVILAAVEPRAEALRELAARYTVYLWCSFNTEWAEGSLSLPASLMRRCGALGLDVDVAVLSGGRVPDR